MSPNPHPRPRPNPNIVIVVLIATRPESHLLSHKDEFSVCPCPCPEWETSCGCGCGYGCGVCCPYGGVLIDRSYPIPILQYPLSAGFSFSSGVVSHPSSFVRACLSCMEIPKLPSYRNRTKKMAVQQKKCFSITVLL